MSAFFLKKLHKGGSTNLALREGAKVGAVWGTMTASIIGLSTAIFLQQDKTAKYGPVSKVGIPLAVTGFGTVLGAAIGAASNGLNQFKLNNDYQGGSANSRRVPKSKRNKGTKQKVTSRKRK